MAMAMAMANNNIGRPPKLSKRLTSQTGIGLTDDARKELWTAAHMLSVKAGRQVSMADIIRVGIELAMEMKECDLLERMK
jgi:hypothetical protein